MFTNKEEAICLSKADITNYMIPILPIILINGAEYNYGNLKIKLPFFGVEEIIQNIIRLINKESMTKMKPFKDFNGQIDNSIQGKIVSSGLLYIVDEETIEITELPINVSAFEYKNVLKELLYGNPPKILDIKEFHSQYTLKFIIKMTKEQFAHGQKVVFL
jgi:DNA topoisomerase-2